MLLKSLRLVSSCLVSALLLAACHSDAVQGQEGEGDADTQRDSMSLKVGVLPTLDCMPMYLAEELGLFDKNGVDVQLNRYNAHIDCDEQLIKSQLDGACSELVRAERLRGRGVTLEYPIATNTYWQLYTNRLARISELKQLGDKMLAITRFSATDYLGNLAVDSAKPQNNVFRIQVNDVTVRLKMLQTNVMDAMLLTEPQATAARIDRHPMLMDSRQKGLQLGVVAFRSDALKGKLRRSLLDRFIKAYNQACDSLNAHGLRYYGDMVKRNCMIDDRILEAIPEMSYTHAAPPRDQDVQTAKTVKWKD